ncbi:MAG TPA: Asd/ArgC dimerization domain-containing protein [Candidatus Angelobacter sp.]|nr:Asd/ArgC dimerization domain-containing protein [Candidatus Angelobacter sp.]
MRSENHLFRAAIIGAATLKGRELKDVLEERNFPAVDVRLLDDDESLGQLERVQDEVSFIQPVTADQLENIDFTFFASESDFTSKNWKMAREAGSAVIDLSYALENDSAALLGAPWIERELGRQTHLNLDSNIVSIAHPAAVTLALLLLRAGRAAAIRRVVAAVFEPVSERGRRGMDELHEQTIKLLSFQQMPKEVFDAQVAFNMLGQYGASAKQSLELVERRIGQHLRRLLGRDAPPLTLMLLQAPVFHAHTFAIHIELEKSLSPGDFSRAIAGDHVLISRSPAEGPSNVNVAGKDDILVSLRRSASQENETGFWIWAAVDNLRLAAITAFECATALAAVRPHGKVQ